MSEPIRAGSNTQGTLFIESLEEAVEAVAVACGGKKHFAALLRPDLGDEPEKAHRWLLDALNCDRRTEFHAEHLRRACRIAREYGCHVLKHWFDDATGYERTDVAPGKTKHQELAGKYASHAAEMVRLADELAAIDRAEVMTQIRRVR